MCIRDSSAGEDSDPGEGQEHPGTAELGQAQAAAASAHAGPPAAAGSEAASAVAPGAPPPPPPSQPAEPSQPDSLAGLNAVAPETLLELRTCYAHSCRFTRIFAGGQHRGWEAYCQEQDHRQPDFVGGRARRCTRTRRFPANADEASKLAVARSLWAWAFHGRSCGPGRAHMQLPDQHLQLGTPGAPSGSAP
eukprot:1334694-Alexandrium_andersonii.AAC.1